MPTTTEPIADGGGEGFALFETPIGCCAIAWRGDAIVRTALPEPEWKRLRSRFIGQGFAEATPPAHVAAAIEAVTRLLSGEPEGLSDIAIDLADASDFERRVYAAARAIPIGDTLTYGELAARIGMPDAARAVGHALGRNPCPIVVPCHRILGGAGKSGGFSAPGGTSTKLKMLEIEGARRGPDAALFDRLPWAMKPGT